MEKINNSEQVLLIPAGVKFTYTVSKSMKAFMCNVGPTHDVQIL